MPPIERSASKTVTTASMQHIHTSHSNSSTNITDSSTLSSGGLNGGLSDGLVAGASVESVESLQHFTSILDTPAPLHIHHRLQIASGDHVETLEATTYDYEVAVRESGSWTLKWKLMVAYACFVAVILFTGTVLMLTVPDGTCEEGCLEENCKNPNERQPHPCKCQDDQRRWYCTDMVQSAADERHKTAAWILVAIAGLLALAVPCLMYWCSGVHDIVQRVRGKYSSVTVSVKFHSAA